MVGSTRSSSRRGGKGRGRGRGLGNVERMHKDGNFVEESSLNTSPPGRPSLDQAPQPGEHVIEIPETSRQNDFAEYQLPEANQQISKSQPQEMTGSTWSRSRQGGKGRGRGRGRSRGNVERMYEHGNFVAVSSLNMSPTRRHSLDQPPEPQAHVTGIPETSTQSHFDEYQLPEANQLINKSQPQEMTTSTWSRSRRGGKGRCRGRSNVEGIHDNLTMASSLNVTPPRRPVPEQPSQQQAHPPGSSTWNHFVGYQLAKLIQQITKSQPEAGSTSEKDGGRVSRLQKHKEMTRFARDRGRQARKGSSHDNAEGIRDNFAASSPLDCNPPQGLTRARASQHPVQETGIGTRNNESSVWRSQNLRSPETSEGSSDQEGSVQHIPDNLNSGAASCNYIRKGRGKYRSIKVDMKTRDGSKITVDIPDDANRAVGPGARDLVNYCGLVMRNTISFREVEWAKICAKQGQEMWLKVKEKFEVGGGKGEHVLQDFVMTTIQRLFRTWKTRLHAEYLRYNTDKDRLSHPPKDVTPENWKFLVHYFESPAFKAASERNKMNRKMQRTKHFCGSKSFAEVEESMRDPLTGEKAPPDRVWELQHTRKNERGELLWSDPQSQQIHGQIKELVAQQQHEQNEYSMTGDDILAAILGERTGYVRGKGYGKKPPRKQRTQVVDLESGLSSAIESVRETMQADMDRKLEEEREQMRAEMVRTFQDQMEEELRQMRKEMDKKIQDTLATLVVRMQQGQDSSTARAIQDRKQKSTEVSWGVKRKRK